MKTTKWEDLDHKAERPLHVRVAEALGERVYLEDPLPPFPQGFVGDPIWRYARDEKGRVQLGYTGQPVTRYDTDWAATGPLIEKYGIGLNPFGDGNPKDCSDPMSWFARHERREWGKWDEVEAATPLFAVCELILVLAELGELLPWVNEA